MSTTPSIRCGLVIDPSRLSFKQCIRFTIKNNVQESVNVLPQLLQQQQQQSAGSDWGGRMKIEMSWLAPTTAT